MVVVGNHQNLLKREFGMTNIFFIKNYFVGETNPCLYNAVRIINMYFEFVAY